jgi:hypothetical protein
MPDLNQKNPCSVKLPKAKCHLIEYADLDGFRVDTYNYADPLVLPPD